METFNAFLKDEAGATAIEYALIAALVAIVAVAGFTATGNNIRDTYFQVADLFCTGVGGTYAATGCTF